MGLRDWLVNLLALLGAAVVAYGLWRFYEPAGIVAVGVALILTAVALVRADDEYRKRSTR